MLKKVRFILFSLFICISLIFLISSVYAYDNACRVISENCNEDEFFVSKIMGENNYNFIKENSDLNGYMHLRYEEIPYNFCCEAKISNESSNYQPTDNFPKDGILYLYKKNNHLFFNQDDKFDLLIQSINEHPDIENEFIELGLSYDILITDNSGDVIENKVYQPDKGLDIFEDLQNLEELIHEDKEKLLCGFKIYSGHIFSCDYECPEVGMDCSKFYTVFLLDSESLCTPPGMTCQQDSDCCFSETRYCAKYLDQDGVLVEQDTGFCCFRGESLDDSDGFLECGSQFEGCFEEQCQSEYLNYCDGEDNSYWKNIGCIPTLNFGWSCCPKDPTMIGITEWTHEYPFGIYQEMQIR